MSAQEDEPKDSLSHLARESDVESFEAAWLEAIDGKEPTPDLLEAYHELSGEKRHVVGHSLLELLFEACTERKDAEGILAVGAELLSSASRGDLDLEPALRDALGERFGQESWYASFLRLSGLEEESALQASQGGGMRSFIEALEQFDALRRFLPGSVVYHSSGWKEGLVADYDPASEQISIQFRQDGTVRQMPITSALDVLTTLAEDDLRTRLLVDEEGLKEEAASSPSLLVRAVARLHRDRATVKEMKLWLYGTVIEERSWNSWWKKAKQAGLQDPFLAVDNPSRPVFVLRKKALTAEEEMGLAMEGAASLVELLKVVAGPLSLDPEADLKGRILSAVKSGVADEGETSTERLAGALLLRRHGESQDEFIATLLDGMLAEESVTFATIVSALGNRTERRDLFEVYAAAKPDLWSDGIIGELDGLPTDLLGLVADRLTLEGRGAALANRFRIFLLTPSRYADAVLALSRRFVAGDFSEIEGAPDSVNVCHGLLCMAETQAPRAERGDKEAKDVMKELERLIIEKGLASQFVEQGSQSDLESSLSVMARCATLPSVLVNAVRVPIEKRFPDLIPRKEIPFWESGPLFTSKDGMLRRQEEYRVLLEEKIPENSADIGRAASYGDLSENFEWTAAIEQQRQLTEKAAAMEAELRVAQLIEDQELVDGVVSPGMVVTYSTGGETHQIRIFGPWERGEDVVSYQAPLAAGMLGGKEGDTLVVDLPSGSVEVTVTAVVPA